MGVALASPSVSGAAPVALIRGTASVANGSERDYAGRVADRVERWLRDEGVPVASLTDEQAASGLAPGTRVAVLPYNPNPPASEVRQLAAFLSRGGRLIVCYSGSAELAQAMGMRLGEYRSEALPGRWSAFRFTAAAPPYVPPLIRQSSRNIRAATPVAGRSQTIAVWEDDAGRPTGDPAWVQSGQGFWMSHILLDATDVAAKRRLLLALVAACDASVWDPAARHLARCAGALWPGADLEDSVQRVRAAAAATGRLAAVEPALAQALAVQDRMDKKMAAGRFTDVIADADLLSVALARAYGLAQSARAGEMRAVWDHYGLGLYPGNWKRTGRELASRGITDVFSNVAWPGLALYASPTLAVADIARARGDLLAAGLEGAHAAGLRLHAWKVCWRTDKAPPELQRRWRSEGRMQVSDAGRGLDWLCPTDPRNRGAELAAVRELATRHRDLDGIHLDYIRYPDSHACYCPGCRARFERQGGAAVAAWPRDVRAGGAREDAFLAWRAAQVTAFVRDCRSELRAANPRLQLSAAVYGSYPSCVRSVGQDWVRWVRDGWLDFACPMNYTEDPAKFARYVELQMQGLGRGFERKLVPGLGVTAAESHLTAAATIDQVLLARRSGAGGFALFDLNPELAEGVLPVLSLGLTR